MIVAVDYRSPTRIRVLFSGTLGAGAFATASFSVESLDDKGVDPTLRQVLIVPDSPHTAELALADDLAAGASYAVHAYLIPFTGPTSTEPADQEFAFWTPGAIGQAPSPSISANDVDALVYGADIVWDGNDFAETADGDLARIVGPENARQAAEHRITSDGLLWDPTFGAKPRQYVDGTAGALPDLRGVIINQILLDDRFTAVTAAVLPQDDVTASAMVDVAVTLVGGQRVAVQQPIPTGGGG